MKKSQMIQLTRERTEVRLRVKMGSPCSILLTVQSASTLMPNKATLSRRPLVNPSRERKRAKGDTPAMMQIRAVTARDFWSEGRENRER